MAPKKASPDASPSANASSAREEDIKNRRQSSAVRRPLNQVVTGSETRKLFFAYFAQLSALCGFALSG
jgi:hypothetical protein